MRYLCRTKKKDSGTEVVSFTFLLLKFWINRISANTKQKNPKLMLNHDVIISLIEDRNACYWFPVWLSKIPDACYIIRHMRHALECSPFSFLTWILVNAFIRSLQKNMWKVPHTVSKESTTVWRRSANTQSTKHLQTKDQTAWGGTHFLL